MFKNFTAQKKNSIFIHVCVKRSYKQRNVAVQRRKEHSSTKKSEERKEDKTAHEQVNITTEEEREWHESKTGLRVNGVHGNKVKSSIGDGASARPGNSAYSCWVIFCQWKVYMHQYLACRFQVDDVPEKPDAL